MQTHRITFAALVFSAFVSVGPLHAQTATPQPNTTSSSAVTANPEIQKQLSPSRRAMKKQRRAQCEKQAADQKLHLTKRWRFMRSCLKTG
jgi:hypothetical protein